MIENAYAKPLFACEENCYYLDENTRNILGSSGEFVTRLSKKQLALLELLTTSPNIIVSTDDAINRLWGDCVVDLDLIDNLRYHIVELRKKLTILDPFLAKKVITYIDSGYMWGSMEFTDRNTQK